MSLAYQRTLTEYLDARYNDVVPAAAPPLHQRQAHNALRQVLGNVGGGGPSGGPGHHLMQPDITREGSFDLLTHPHYRRAGRGGDADRVGAPVPGRAVGEAMAVGGGHTRGANALDIGSAAMRSATTAPAAGGAPVAQPWPPSRDATWHDDGRDRRLDGDGADSMGVEELAAAGHPPLAGGDAFQDDPRGTSGAIHRKRVSPVRSRTAQSIHRVVAAGGGDGVLRPTATTHPSRPPAKKQPPGPARSGAVGAARTSWNGRSVRGTTAVATAATTSSTRATSGFRTKAGGSLKYRVPGGGGGGCGVGGLGGAHARGPCRPPHNGGVGPGDGPQPDPAAPAAPPPRPSKYADLPTTALPPHTFRYVTQPIPIHSYDASASSASLDSLAGGRRAGVGCGVASATVSTVPAATRPGAAHRGALPPSQHPRRERDGSAGGGAVYGRGDGGRDARTTRAVVHGDTHSSWVEDDGGDHEAGPNAAVHRGPSGRDTSSAHLPDSDVDVDLVANGVLPPRQMHHHAAAHGPPTTSVARSAPPGAATAAASYRHEHHVGATIPHTGRPTPSQPVSYPPSRHVVGSQGGAAAGRVPAPASTPFFLGSHVAKCESPPASVADASFQRRPSHNSMSSSFAAGGGVASGAEAGRGARGPQQSGGDNCTAPTARLPEDLARTRGGGGMKSTSRDTHTASVSFAAGLSGISASTIAQGSTEDDTSDASTAAPPPAARGRTATPPPRTQRPPAPGAAGADSDPPHHRGPTAAGIAGPRTAMRHAQRGGATRSTWRSQSTPAPSTTAANDRAAPQPGAPVGRGASRGVRSASSSSRPRSRPRPEWVGNGGKECRFRVATAARSRSLLADREQASSRVDISHPPRGGSASEADATGTTTTFRRAGRRVMQAGGEVIARLEDLGILSAMKRIDQGECYSSFVGEHSMHADAQRDVKDVGQDARHRILNEPDTEWYEAKPRGDYGRRPRHAVPPLLSGVNWQRSLNESYSKRQEVRSQLGLFAGMENTTMQNTDTFVSQDASATMAPPMRHAHANASTAMSSYYRSRSTPAPAELYARVDPFRLTELARPRLQSAHPDSDVARAARARARQDLPGPWTEAPPQPRERSVNVLEVEGHVSEVCEE